MRYALFFQTIKRDKIMGIWIGIIVGITVFIVIFIAIRALNCWYWKIDKRLAVQEKICKNLEELFNRINASEYQKGEQLDEISASLAKICDRLEK